MIVGRTTDGRPVIDGLFALYATDGIPLALVFMLCHAHDLVPSWPAFYREARANGWTHQTILTRLREALGEAYPRDWATAVLSRLECWRDDPQDQGPLGA